MEQYYYPETIKNITVSVMDLFNGLVVKKKDINGTITHSKPVPLTFGPVEKFHQDRKENHYYDLSAVEHGKRYYLSLPRMALTLDAITHNPDRVYGANEWRYWFQEALSLTAVDAQNVFADYQPTPYDLGFTLHIMTDRLDYFSQILENILPYFNPMLSLRVKEFSFLNIERDIPVYLENVTPDFIDNQGESDTRFVNATIALRAEAWMYRPITEASVITHINSRYYVGISQGFDTSGNAIIADSSATYQVMDINTSGFDTSGGLLTIAQTGASAITVDDYILSGHYDSPEVSAGKNFYWFKSVSATI